MIKCDMSYDQWIYEVKVDTAHYSDSVLKEGMIHSLRGVTILNMYLCFLFV